MDARPAPEPPCRIQAHEAMVFSAAIPRGQDQYGELKVALEKLSLKTARSPGSGDVRSPGFGFRCGFLGAAPSRRSCRSASSGSTDWSFIATVPNVRYQVTLLGGESVTVENPPGCRTLPDREGGRAVRAGHHPRAHEYVGNIMKPLPG